MQASAFILCSNKLYIYMDVMFWVGRKIWSVLYHHIISNVAPSQQRISLIPRIFLLYTFVQNLTFVWAVSPLVSYLRYLSPRSFYSNNAKLSGNIGLLWEICLLILSFIAPCVDPRSSCQLCRSFEVSPSILLVLQRRTPRWQWGVGTRTLLKNVRHRHVHK